jgi:hypothetical protein
MNSKGKHDYLISIFDLFRYSSLRFITILSIVIHLLISFQFLAPGLALKDYSLSIYTNSTLLGFSELLASIVCYFIVDCC